MRAQLAETVKLVCPHATCEAELSVRDVKELLHGGEADAASRSSGAAASRATHDASRRLMAELELIADADPKTDGYEVDLVDENLYLWEVKLSFDDCPLADDLKKAKKDHILMHIKFPPDFPFAPPVCVAALCVLVARSQPRGCSLCV